MDAGRFDRLPRAYSTTSRRSILRGMAGSGAGAAFVALERGGSAKSSVLKSSLSAQEAPTPETRYIEYFIQLEDNKRNYLAEQASFIRETFLSAIQGLPEEQIPEAVQDFALVTGVDPETIRPLFDPGTAAPPNFVVARAPRRRFGFETYAQCLEDGCEAAGGEWKDPPDWRGPDCYFREGTTVAEKAATMTAYTWVIYECLGGGVLGFFRELL